MRASDYSFTIHLGPRGERRLAPMTTKPKSVVLLSGGMDSCVCAALAARDTEASALHISYGQRTEAREREAFLAICARLGIRNQLVVRNEALRAIGGSALTDPTIAVPDAPPELASHAQQIPITYVPSATPISSPSL